MGRAQGRKNTPREPQGTSPETPEGKYIGESVRQQSKPDNQYGSPIPGGSTGGPHITNHPTVRQHVPVPPPKPENRGITAHGVPVGDDEFTTRQHAVHERGSAEVAKVADAPKPQYRDRPDKKIHPVPVYIVEESQGAHPLRTIAGDKFNVPASTSDPIRIAGRDYDRSEIMLLCETPAGASGAAPTGVRIDHEVGNLTLGKGFLIPAANNSYTRLNTCDELFAVSNDGSACTLSVVYLYGVAGGA